MNEPLVSIIIPAYKQAEFLGQAIQSALGQTYRNLEVIVVDDHSPDHTAAVVQQFADGRLRYIAHDRNRMLAAARNTGICAARGEFIALLDADDYYHREKLALHIEYLQQTPKVGISYSGRYELRCGRPGVRNIVRAPLTVGIGDLVMGFPFCINDTVLRRSAIFSVELFDESYGNFSEDLDINCRLALAGWQFGMIDRCLSYRRFHPGRLIHNPRQRLDAALRSLGQTFVDPRTPPEVQALKDRAYANHLVVWGVEALRSGDTAMGVDILRQAAKLEPELLKGNPCRLSKYFVYEAAHDDSTDLGEVYNDLVAQLPDDFEAVRRQMKWGIGRAWLVNAYRYLLWNSTEEGRTCLAEAARRGACVDEMYISEVVYQLLGMEQESSRQSVDQVAGWLDKQYYPVISGVEATTFSSALEMGRAYEYFNTGRVAEVPSQVLRAICSSPRRALNRASLSMLTRAAVRSRKFAGAGDKFTSGRMGNSE